MKVLKVLVVGEVSGIIRDAFNRKGHIATSCDINPQRSPGRHIQSDVRNIKNIENTDLLIAHPECRYLSNSGVHCLHKYPSRWGKMVEAAMFFKWLLMLRIPMICVENPVIHGYAKRYIGFGQSQSIQPYDFGEDASKRTCFWLKGLPKLKNTNYFEPRLVEHKGKIFKRWSNQTDSGQNRLGPSDTRSIERAITYNGVADAMAEQWG